MVRFCLLFAALGAAGVRAQSLDAFLEQGAAASPELAQARAAVEAERARIPQSRALPDPTLSLGVQNDGFTKWNVGTMETSFFSIGLTQPLPWPGKRDLRESVASFEEKRAEARLARVALDVEARVRRAYIALSLARGQLALLSEQETLWTQAESTARSRYEAGQAPQADLLRAQLERARLQQRRWALDAEISVRTAELNRLRAHPLDEPIEAAPLIALPDKPASALEADALERSPELQLARLGTEQAGRRIELAQKEKRPDFAISGAVMLRGPIEPMWQLGVSIGLPIFGTGRQDQAVHEGEQRRIGEVQGAEALRQVVVLRARERAAVLSALSKTSEHYRTQILVLSSATTRSTLSQYEAGRIPFAAVLEALAGYVGDRTSALSTVAEAHQISVAQREVSLDPVSAMGAGPGTGGMPGTSSAQAAAASAPQGSPEPSSSPARSSGMGGM